jgi:hypothetical protein
MVALSLSLLGLLGVAAAVWVNPATLDACPGYNATNVQSYGSTLTADLSLAGEACNVFGPDIKKLKLEVTYETGEILCSLRRKRASTDDVRAQPRESMSRSPTRR